MSEPADASGKSGPVLPWAVAGMRQPRVGRTGLDPSPHPPSCGSVEVCGMEWLISSGVLLGPWRPSMASDGGIKLMALGAPLFF